MPNVVQMAYAQMADVQSWVAEVASVRMANVQLATL